jgi:phage gpG-like protein
MATTMVVDVHEIFDLAKQCQGAAQIVAEETGVAMERSAILVQNAARTNIQQQHAIDTGRLLGSVTREVKPFEASIGTNVAYARPVEEGRQSGAPMPPTGSLLGWMNRHGIPAEREFVIRRAIARRGIRARPYLLPALENNRTQIAREFAVANRRIAARVLA